MALFIILNAAEAEQVRGPSAIDPAASLIPVERQGGTFILGSAVLADPAHEAHWQFLIGLPQKRSDAGDFPPPMPEE